MSISATLRRIENHLVQIEEDLVRVELYGDLTTQIADELVKSYEAVMQQWGHALILVGIDNVGFTQPKARRTLVAWSTAHAGKVATAVFGGTFAVRSMMMLMNTAVRVLTGRTQPLGFFKTEAEARSFLQQERGQL